MTKFENDYRQYHYVAFSELMRRMIYDGNTVLKDQA
jgi:hypothetical protein